jgi:hypothetical protein
MASFVYTPAKSKLLSGDLDLNTHDIRVMLLKTSGNTTADTDQDAAVLSDITTLGEISATNYVRKALANEAVNTDNANNRGEFDADDVTWTALGGASNDTIGAILVYRHVDGTAANDIPIAYIDGAIFPGGASSMTTNGGDVTLGWNAEGIIQAT